MENKEIFEILPRVKKGRYVSIRKRKDLGKGVTKISDVVIRLGVNYAHMKVNEGREVGPLPWGHWVEGYEGLVIEHKGAYYLRVANGYTKHVKSRYFLHGEEVDESIAASVVGAAKLASSDSAVFNVRFENIVAIRVD